MTHDQAQAICDLVDAKIELALAYQHYPNDKLRIERIEFYVSATVSRCLIRMVDA